MINGPDSLCKAPVRVHSPLLDQPPAYTFRTLTGQSVSQSVNGQLFVYQNIVIITTQMSIIMDRRADGPPTSHRRRGGWAGTAAEAVDRCIWASTAVRYGTRRHSDSAGSASSFRRGGSRGIVYKARNSPRRSESAAGAPRRGESNSSSSSSSADERSAAHETVSGLVGGVVDGTMAGWSVYMVTYLSQV